MRDGTVVRGEHVLRRGGKEAKCAKKEREGKSREKKNEPEGERKVRAGNNREAEKKEGASEGAKHARE